MEEEYDDENKPNPTSRLAQLIAVFLFILAVTNTLMPLYMFINGLM